LRALERARDTVRERRHAAAVAADGRAAEPPPGPRPESEPEPDAPAGSAEPFTPAPRQPNIEALVALADMSLTCEHADRSGGERCQVVVHVDAAVLSADADGRCELEHGPALSPETARRVACDASLVTIAEVEGAPLSVGRRTRTIPPTMRRALAARDQTCCFPGCNQHRFLHAHHLQHWARGGDTSVDNLALLCRHHHRLVHEGGYSVERPAPGRLRFRDPDGVAIPSAPRSPPADANGLLERNRRSGHTIDANTNLNGTGDRMDLGLTVDSLLQIIG
jgi:hypothetical protein